MEKDCFDCKYFDNRIFLCEKPAHSHFVLSPETDAKYCSYFSKGRYNKEEIIKEIQDKSI